MAFGGALVSIFITNAGHPFWCGYGMGEMYEVIALFSIPNYVNYRIVYINYRLYKYTKCFIL